MRSLFAVLALSLVGCAVNVDRDDAEQAGDTSDTAGALSVYGEKLVGAFATTAPDFDFDKIVLKSDGTYFSSKSIACFTTPCIPIRDEGKFIGYKPVKGSFIGGLRLVSKKGGKARQYQVSLGSANESFKLSADGGKTFKKFETVGTFCTENSDCKGQSYAHIMCVGYASCNAKSQKCGWTCGVEPTKCDTTSTPTKKYIGTSPEQCSLIRFACAEGFSYFSDACGCGCEKTGVSTLPACKPRGCSGQVCSDKDMITTCEWRESYACYQKLGICERGADGACGWRSTNELEACLEGSL